MPETARPLDALVRATPAAEFIEALLATTDAPGGIPFRAAFASVPRRLGAAATTRLIEPHGLPAVSRRHWTLTDWTRALLVERAVAHAPLAEQPSVVLRIYEAGELGEQESVLRTLALLPDAARFVDTGVAGCRTNAKRVFEAIACDNPFPADHFPELNFNQMVMKALFIEAPVALIEGLAMRRGPELVRMAHDYASERRAAGRPVPPDLAHVLEGS